MYETFGDTKQATNFNGFETPYDVDAQNFSRLGRRFAKPGKQTVAPINRHQVKFHNIKNNQVTLRPLEEHFENFVDTVNEVSEPFLKGLKNLFKNRAAIKDKKKQAKTDVIQAKADVARIQANAEAQARIIEAQAAAQAQAAATNQLQQSLYPGSAPVQPQATPQYQSYPDTMMSDVNANNWRDVTEPGYNAAIEQAATPTATAAEKRKKYIMFAIIALVVIGAVVYFVKYKKK